MQQHFTEGTRCLASSKGHWTDATIRRLNDDGSYKIEYDEKEMLLMPFWYGVTKDELAVDDEARWNNAAPRISGSNWDFSRTDLSAVLARLGYSFSVDQLDDFWVKSCHSLFGLTSDVALDTRLDVAQAYQIIRTAGLSAKQIAEHDESMPHPEPFFKLYWNQIRMGGRNPEDVPRAITLDDTCAALGLKNNGTDMIRAKALDAWQISSGVTLPPILTTFLTREGVANAITDSHPNSPELLDIDNLNFVLQSGMRERGVPGDYAVMIMLPHQGDHAWFAAFDEGDDNARICVGSHDDEMDNEGWILTAPSVDFFFWDLAQTGLGWFEDTQHRGGKPTVKTDVGVALKL